MGKIKSSIREEIGNYISELKKENKNIIVLNADLMGSSRNKNFVEEYPKSAFNFGIAEQQMVSFAAGMAHEGFMPYVFTMAPFLSMRACEQVRTDIAYANLNVRLVGGYSGVSGGISGVTHWGIEDCAIMRAIPNMTIIEPSSAVQTRFLLKETLKYNGPIYIRSTVELTDENYLENDKFEIGKASIIKDGKDGAFITSGVVTQFALEAAKEIENQLGKHIRVIDMHTVKPIDNCAVIEAAKTGKVIVAQDHNIIGGLGSACAEVIAKANIASKFKILGIPDSFDVMAHATFLYNKYGYDTEGLIKAMKVLFS